MKHSRGRWVEPAPDSISLRDARSAPWALGPSFGRLPERPLAERLSQRGPYPSTRSTSETASARCCDLDALRCRAHRCRTSLRLSARFCRVFGCGRGRGGRRRRGGRRGKSPGGESRFLPSFLPAQRLRPEHSQLSTWRVAGTKPSSLLAAWPWRARRDHSGPDLGGVPSAF